MTVTGVLSTETSAAVASAVGAPSNGQVTAAVSTPVRNSGRPSRSIEAPATELVADVDDGPRVAVVVTAPMRTPTAVPTVLPVAVPLAAGADVSGLTRVSPSNSPA